MIVLSGRVIPVTFLICSTSRKIRVVVQVVIVVWGRVVPATFLIVSMSRWIRFETHAVQIVVTILGRVIAFVVT